MPLSSAGLELTLDGLQDALFVLNKEWLIVYANRQAETMLRMSAEQLLGSSQWTVFPESSTSLVGSLYREAVATGEAKRFEFFYELANTWFEVNACPSLIGLTVTFRDITENKKTTAALMQSEKLAAVGRLASSMAHEINNPLEAITNLLYLSRQAATSLNVKDWLDQADLELRRVSVIANQTLRFHRQSSRPQSITCLSLFSATLSLHEARLKNASILVEKRKRANEPVEIFEGDIRQVLSNIVTNAIDAMPTGGRLIVRSREGTDWSTGRTGLVLTLADTGIGMDYETRCRMFEAFYTTKGIGGSGLGLWISADIMQRHEGRITIRSSQLPGTTGTVVVLFLPFEAAAKAGLVTAEQAMLA